MQIEYKIRFQKDGLTVSETIDTNGTAGAVRPAAPVVQNWLRASFAEHQAAASISAQSGAQSDSPEGGGPGNRPRGGGPGNRPRGGTPVSDGTPVTIIGPFIFLCPPKEPETNHGN
jgi:hypothetical protein